MKYIDSDKLIAEIERRIINGQDGYGGNLKALLPFITSLQQEAEDKRIQEYKEAQEVSIKYRDSVIQHIEQKRVLPSNLDEAADKYAKENCENYVDEEDGVTYIEEALRNTFKAGANWMAGKFVLVGGEPTGWFRANDGSEYATGLDLKEPIKLPVNFYVRKK